MRRLLVLAAVALAGVLGVLAWFRSDLTTYRHDLVRFEGDRAEANRFLDLAGGDGQLSIGSPDRRSVVVQWRDPDGAGWTEPTTTYVLRERGLDFYDTTAREAGGTVAVLALFADDDEYDGDDLTVGLVCRDRRCWVQEEPGFGGEPEVAPDGRTAYLGEDEQGAWVWDEAGGIRRVEWTGHPPYGAGPVTASQPALAPDGSLRVAAARVVPGGCRFTLLASAPLDGALEEVATAVRPRRAPADSRCRPFLDVPSVDRVVVRPVDPGQRAFGWDRTGGGWVVGRPRTVG